MFRKLLKQWLPSTTPIRKPPRVKPPLRPQLETLELRAVPATISLYSAGNRSGIRIDGTANHDTVIIREQNGQIEVTHTAPNESQTVVSYNREWIEQIKYYGNGGRDFVDDGTQPGNNVSTENIELYAYGGGDADIFIGGPGRDYLYGGGGNDTLNGGEGHDILEGEAGNDTLRGGDDNDKLYGGDDADLLEGGNKGDFLDGGNDGDAVYANTEFLADADDELDFDAYRWVYDGATYDDVDQEKADNCGFMSSLAAIANTGEDLTDRIRYLGHNRYEVLMYSDGFLGFNSGWYWENASFSGGVSDEDAGMRKSADGAFGEFWVVVYQRAYLNYLYRHPDLVETIGQAAGATGFAFAGTAMTALTARSYTITSCLVIPTAAEEQAHLRAIRDALDQNQPVVGVTWSGYPGLGMSTPLLESWHAYTVLGTDVGENGEDVLVLRNPWANNDGNGADWEIDNDGLLHVSITDFLVSMHDYYIGNVAGQADMLFDAHERAAAYDDSGDTIEVRADPADPAYAQILYNSTPVRRVPVASVRSLTIRGSEDPDTFRVHTDGLDFPITLAPRGGPDVLEVVATGRSDSFESHAGLLAVDTGLSNTVVKYSGIPTVVVDTGDADDFVWIYGVADDVSLTVNSGKHVDYFTASGAAGRALRLNGGDDTDYFSVTSTAVGMTTANGIVVNGDDGGDKLYLNATANVPTTSPARIHLTLNGGIGNDTITVGDILDMQTVTLNGGDGADTLAVQNAQAGAVVTVNGDADADTFVGPNVASTWTLDGTNAGKVNGLIPFATVESVKGGRVPNASPTTVHNRFEVHPTAALAGTIDGNGTTGTRLVFLDASNTTGGAYTVGRTAITLPGNRSFAYTAIGTVELNTAANKVATVTVTGTSGRVTINTGNLDDTVAIATTNRTLSDLGGELTIAGGGKDSLTIDDTGRSSPAVTNYSVTEDWFERDGAYRVNYPEALGKFSLDGAATKSRFNVVSVAGAWDLQGGAAGDTLTAYGLEEGTTVSFDGGGGSDTLELLEGVNAWTVTGPNKGEVTSAMTIFNVVHNSKTTFENVENLTGGPELDTFAFAVGGRIDGTIDGGGGPDGLTVNDAALASGQLYTLTTTSLMRGNVTAATFDGLAQLTLIAGPAADEVTVLGTPAGTTVTLNLGGSNGATYDGVEVSTLAAVQGALTVNGVAGRATLLISDQTATERHDYTLTTSGLTRAGAAAITFQNLGDFQITGTPFDDEFLVVGLPAPTVSIDGLGSGNSMIGPNASNAWQILGTDQGALTSGGRVSTFTAVGKLTGGTHDDRFSFASGQGVSGTINGGPGNDTLDFSAFGPALGLDLNLATGKTNRGASKLTSFDNVLGTAGPDTVYGTEGANILVGGGGNDALHGLEGRDLLIGGEGADILRGGAHDDIMIGGYTTLDANLPALTAIMSEWNSLATSYAKRLDHLRGTLPGGLNGSWYLNPTTVRQDKLPDNFLGDVGDDWFWGQFPLEVNDRTGGEAMN